MIASDTNEPRPSRIKIEWAVEHFSFLRNQTDLMYSDVVHDNGVAWCLQLKPCNTVEEDVKNDVAGGDFTQLYVYFQRDGQSKLSVQAKFSVMSPTFFGHASAPVYTASFNRIFEPFNGWLGRGFPTFLPQRALFGDGTGSQFILKRTNDKLMLRVDIAYLELERDTGSRKDKQRPVSLIQTDYRQMYESGHYSDFVLVSSDGEERNVHRMILAARSKFFKELFAKRDVAEAEQRRYETALPINVLDALLKMVYFGGTEDVGILSRDLQCAAEKYQLDDLKEVCESVLSSSVAAENLSKPKSMNGMVAFKYLRDKVKRLYQA